MAKKKSNAGRPKKMTEATIGKLEQAFSYDCTIKEACMYAGIHPDTYHDFIKKNPQYSDRFEALREKPVMYARQTVVKSLKTDPKIALKYLERKKKDEFSVRSEHTGKEGGPINVTKVIREDA